jgi:2-oxoglutarate ferredoxin oxidoreductase subunit gamma
VAVPRATDEHRLIAAGFGGQGIMTLGKLLCTAAMREGKNVTYIQSYGAEVRGGTANCQIVVGSGTIYSPLVEQADSLVMLSQLSYDRFTPLLKAGGLLLVNSSTVLAAPEAPAPGARLFLAPATELAAEMGDVRVANVIMLGALLGLTGLVAQETCLGALTDLLGQRRPELLKLNERALVRGVRLAEAPPKP